jgi:Kef-type K+ transport system membrane component KefB
VSVVMGQLMAGLLLGPSFFGLLLPDAQHALFPKSAEQKAMIDAISQFGVLLLLLLTGMETDLKLVRQTGRASLFASLMGIVVFLSFAESYLVRCCPTACCRIRRSG